jgi:hypothetical protein
MTIGTISNGESGLSVRTKLNSVIAEVNGLGTAATEDIGDFATAAQGALADSAVQPGDLATVATTGAYADLSGKPTLGTAAAAATTDFATAAQGSLADSAVQPGDLATVATTGAYADLSGTPSLATVATTGSYTDLTNKPTFGTAAAEDVGYFATAAQGAKADTSVQSVVTGITGADAITNMVSLTQAEYDAIVSPNASTFYVIVG